MVEEVKECPHCKEGIIIEGLCNNLECGAYKVITEADEANYDCTYKQILEGINNDTKPRKTRI